MSGTNDKPTQPTDAAIRNAALEEAAALCDARAAIYRRQFAEFAESDAPEHLVISEGVANNGAAGRKRARAGARAAGTEAEAGPGED